jgi:hypothetical protein
MPNESKLSHAAPATLTAKAEQTATIGVGSGALLGRAINDIQIIYECVVECKKPGIFLRHEEPAMIATWWGSKSLRTLHTNMKNKNNPDTDGCEVAVISTKTRYEMDFRIPIGQTVTISKHPDIKIPEHCLGDWTLIGYNADGAMKLQRNIVLGISKNNTLRRDA